MTRITNQNYPNGLNPLGYMGTNATTPAQQFVQLNRAPTPNDSQNFTMGTNWQVNNGGTKQIWQLVDLTGGVAEWVQIYPAGGGGGGASEFPTDSGTANEVGGVLNILGGLNINTTGVGDTVTVNLDTTISVDGIQDTSMGLGVVLSDASGNLTSLNGSTGQVLIGGTGTDPQWNTLTAGTNISINSSVPHQITISASGINPGSSCAFLLYQATPTGNVTGDGTTYALGEDVAMTKFFDLGNNVTTGDGAGTPAIFTAPATGYYQLQLVITTLRFSGTNFQTPTISIAVTGNVATTNTYLALGTTFPNSSISGTVLGANMSTLVKMTSGDEAVFQVSTSAGSLSTAVAGHAMPTLESWFSGYRIA